MASTEIGPLGTTRVLLLICLPVVVGLIFNSLATDGAARNNALASSGWAGIAGWAGVFVGFAIALALSQIRRRPR